MPNIIYGLIDPNTNELRYVGFTTRPHIRFSDHCKPSFLRSPTHKNNWIKQLKNNNQKPIFIIIEEYNNKEELPQAEIDMIAYFKYIGCNLTNSTGGGRGTFGRIVPEETRKKISMINKGRKVSEEARKKWKIANKGKPSPNKGKKASEELRKKLSLAHIGIQGKKRILSKEQEEEIIKEVSENPDIKKTIIAKKYGVKKNVIYSIFRRLKKIT
jgi:hypothetical protein